MMNCSETCQDMGLYVLGDLPEAQHARIAAHVAGCASCRQAEQEYRLLVCEIQFGTSVAPVSRDIVDRVQACTAQAITTARLRNQLGKIATAAAAMLLLGLSVWCFRGELFPDSLNLAVQHKNVRGESLASLPEKWRYGGTRGVPSSSSDEVVVHGSNLYLLQDSTLGSRVTAVNLDTGQQRWQSLPINLAYLSADASHVFGLARRGGVLEVVAISASEGHELWRYPVTTSRQLDVPHTPLSLPGGQICWAHAGSVHMLDTQTGQAIWTHRLQDEGPLSATVADGENVYVVTRQTLYCLGRNSGQELWREPFNSETTPQGRPLLATTDGQIYILQRRPGQPGQLSCVNLSDRREVWTRPVPDARNLLATSGGIYLRGQSVVAMDRQTGEPLWQRAASGCGPLTLIDGLIHFVDSSTSGRLVAVSPQTGQPKWEVRGIHSCNAFTKIGDTGYIKMRDGTVRALAFAGL